MRNLVVALRRHLDLLIVIACLGALFALNDAIYTAVTSFTAELRTDQVLTRKTLRTFDDVVRDLNTKPNYLLKPRSGDCFIT